jgi:hypothetical protein
MSDPWYYSEEPPPGQQRPHPPTERVPWTPARYSQTSHLEQIGPRLPVPPPAPPIFDTRDPWAASAQATAPSFSPGPQRYQPWPAPPSQRYQPAPAPPWQPQPYQPAPRPRGKRRVFLWAFLAVQALFLIWLIAGVAGTSHSGADAHAQAVQWCADSSNWKYLYKSQADCVTHYGNGLNDASDIGKSIGAGVIVAVWVVTDFFLGLGYGIYRLASR